MTGFRDPPTIDIDTEEADRFVGQANPVVRLPSSEPDSALSQFDRAKLALEKAASIEVVKEIRDQAEALRIYAKQAQQSFEMQNHCAEIKIRAERKAGQMLLDQDKNKGAAAPAEERDHIPRLREMGISYSQSSRWQSLAGIPEETFELHLDRIKEANQEVTSALFLKLARKLAKEQRSNDEIRTIVDGVGIDILNDYEKALRTLKRVIEKLQKERWQVLSKELVLRKLQSLCNFVETIE